MDEALKKKIELLLVNANMKFNEHSSHYVYDNQSMIDAFGYPSSVGGLISDNPEDWKLANEHSELLIKLSQQLTKNEAKDLNNLLLSRINGDNPNGMVDAVTLYFVHTKQADLLLKHLAKKLKNYHDNTAYLRSFEVLADAIKHRPDIFSTEVVEQVLDYAEDYISGNSEIGKHARGEYGSLYDDITAVIKEVYFVANEVLVKDFAKQIDTAFNPELNVDEKKVIEEISYLGFPLDLTEQLRYITDLIDNANEPKQYRTVMSAIRVFTERFYEQTAKSLDPLSKIDGKDAEKVAKFFKEKRLLSTDMADLLKAHRHFLSNDGTHRLKSRKEDARIAKNITIELSLYIVTRLREVLDEGK